MQFTLAIAGYLVGLPLELLVIAALLNGAYRQFPTVFAYVVAEFLTTVIEIPLALAWYRSSDAHIGRTYAIWYWRDEIIMQFLVFAVVISLLWLATSAARSRRVLRLMITLGVLLFAGISFAVHHEPPPAPMGRWMTFWARDLNFGAALLDMLLWAMLIAKRQKDTRVLMVSGGLGIMFAGEAIGQSVRSLANQHSAITLPGSILVMLTNLAFLYIWWQTFRVPRPVLVSAP